MWQGRGHIPLRVWMVSPLRPRSGPRAANRTSAMVILQSSPFHGGGHASQRVISLTPRGAVSQRSGKTAGGERACIINQRRPCLFPVHIDDACSLLPISFAWPSTHKGQPGLITRGAKRPNCGVTRLWDAARSVSSCAVPLAWLNILIAIVS